MNSTVGLRPSPIAGQWYSGDPIRLSRQIDDLITRAELPDYTGEIVGLVAPHAGHRYSGRTAAHAYKSVLGKQYDLVVVVSPMHAYSTQPLLTSGHDGYQTPLGSVMIERDAAEMLSGLLRQSINTELVSIYRDGEHAIEIQLPFLQRCLQAPFQLLPVMVHSRSSEIALHLGQALAEIVKDRSALLIASTDLSHFSPINVANELDEEMLRQIAAFSPEGVLKAEHSGTGLACGAVPVAAVLWASRLCEAEKIEIVHYSTSGDETGDYSSVVGYGAALILK